MRAKNSASSVPGQLRDKKKFITSVGMTIALAALSTSLCSAQTAPRGPDFNNDWFDDLAIGSPQENWQGTSTAGMISIGYGSNGGLDVPPGHAGFLTENSSGMQDSAEYGDVFGYGLAWGDFDGDCFDDLAIGAFGEDVNGDSNAGAIHVVYGSGVGISGAGSQFLHRDVSGVAGVSTQNAFFGNEIAAGDFDGDGFDDVAVSAHRDTVGGVVSAGSVHIFYGSPGGLSTIGDKIFSRSSLGLPVVSGDYFGNSLAAGDFDCDGRDDLAIGTPDADPGNKTSAGDVVVLYGTNSGLSTGGYQRWYQGYNGVNGLNEADDHFGTALAVGNFNGDVTPSGRQCLDLAIGSHAEDAGNLASTGAVHVLYGSSSSGLQTNSPAAQIFTQSTSGIAGAPEAYDQFGYSLTIGRFNQDHYDDLAIGIPGEDSGAGAVTIVKGGVNGLKGTGSVQWTQATAGISDHPEAGDRFGDALGYVSKLDWNGSTLLVGVYYEDLNGITIPGLTHAIGLNSHISSGFVLSSEEGLQQSTFGGSSAEYGDRFGEEIVAPRHVSFRCPM